MAAMLDLYSTFARAWPQTMRPLSSALVLSGTGYRAPSLCTLGAQRRPTLVGLDPLRASSISPVFRSNHAAAVVGIGLEWNRIPSPKLVHPGCTATTNLSRPRPPSCKQHLADLGLRAVEKVRFARGTARKSPRCAAEHRVIDWASRSPFRGSSK